MAEIVMDDDDSMHPRARSAQGKRTRRPRGRFARWMIRLVVFVVGLGIALAILLQILLCTDIPRKLVLEKLQATLGLRVEASRMKIGWTGHTSLEDVTISLPLAQQSFLTVPRLEVTHTSLPMILLTQDVTLKEAIFHQPTIRVTQDSAGRWNVAEAIDLITRAGGKKQAQDQPDKPIALPAVTVDGGVLNLVDRDGKEAAVQPLDVSGYPVSALVWKYDARVADQLKLTGKVSPGGFWQHEVAFTLADITPWLSAWIKTFPNAHARGTWRGRVDGAILDEQVIFDDLRVGSLTAIGAASVQRQASGEVTVSPTALVIQTGNPEAPKVTLTSGALVISPSSVIAKDLALSANGGEAKLNGTYSWPDQSATLDVAWHDMEFPQGVSNDGSVTAKLTMPWPGAPRFEADVQQTRRLAAGVWNSHIILSGVGASWSDIDFTATVAQASWSGKRHASIADLKATALLRDRKITLQSVSLPSQQDLSGTGEFNLDDHTWNLKLNGGNIPIQKLADAPAAIRLRASGKDGVATLNEFSLVAGDVEIHAGGFFDSAKPKPVAISVAVAHLPALQGADPSAPIRGQLFGKFGLSGTLSPLDLSVDEGMLYGSDVVLGKRPVGNLAIQLQGRVTEDAASLQTLEARILGGRWRVRADWPDEQDALKLRVDVAELPLSEVGDLFQHKEISGQLAGSWTAQIPAPDKMRVTSTGTAVLTNVVADIFRAERITVQSHYDRGQLVLDPVDLQQADGNAQLHVDLAADHPTLLNVKANIANWPAGDPQASVLATIWAQAELAVDASKKSAVGALNAQLSFRAYDRDTGSLSIDSTLDGQVIRVANLQAVSMGGTAKGLGQLNLAEPMKSTASITFTDLDAVQLASLMPNPQEFAGKVSGMIELAPTTDPRAIGPLKLAVNLESQDLHYKSIDIGHAVLASYFNGSRFVLDRFALDAAGGQVNLWARSTPHGQGARSSQVQIEFSNLDLDKIDQAFDPNPEPMPGRLQGQFMLVGSLMDRDALFGQGSIKVTESNLINVDAIRGLYDLMHIWQPSDANDGTGQIALRLDNNTMTLDNARYFNRGIETRGQIVIRDIWKVPDSRIDGVLIGSVRPLKDIKLPYMADADRILNALQQNLTTVKISGTARKYDVVPISFSEAGDTMRKVVLGEVEK